MKLYTTKAASVGVIVFFIALSVIHMFVLKSCTEVHSCDRLFYKEAQGRMIIIWFLMFEWNDPLKKPVFKDLRNFNICGWPWLCTEYFVRTVCSSFLEPCLAFSLFLSFMFVCFALTSSLRLWWYQSRVKEKMWWSHCIYRSLLIFVLNVFDVMLISCLLNVVHTWCERFTWSCD